MYNYFHEYFACLTLENADSNFFRLLEGFHQKCEILSCKSRGQIQGVSSSFNRIFRASDENQGTPCMFAFHISLFKPVHLIRQG